jgi:hypothetical protein
MKASSSARAVVRAFDSARAVGGTVLSATGPTKPNEACESETVSSPLATTEAFLQRFGLTSLQELTPSSLSSKSVGHRTFDMSNAILMTSQEKFDHWFTDPLSQLSDLKRGNAAFVAFQVSFALWERLIKSQLKREGINANPENFIARSAKDLNLDLDLFDKFWGMYRDGIQHYLQPKPFTSKGIKYGWEIDGDYGPLPEFYEKAPNHKIIRISPWKWANFVASEWRNRLDLLDVFVSHRFGDVY